MSSPCFISLIILVLVVVVVVMVVVLMVVGLRQMCCKWWGWRLWPQSFPTCLVYENPKKHPWCCFYKFLHLRDDQKVLRSVTIKNSASRNV